MNLICVVKQYVRKHLSLFHTQNYPPLLAATTSFFLITSYGSFVSFSVSKFGGRILYDIKEVGTIRESKDTCAEDWIDVAKEIANNYDNYSGFVILHGTDTMAFTASALSFMFENLGKPVVLTGAQVNWESIEWGNYTWGLPRRGLYIYRGLDLIGFIGFSYVGQSMVFLEYI